MNLAAWMDAECITDQVLADQIGVDRSFINRVRNGQCFPRRAIIQAIFTATEGKVTANDLLRATEEQAP